MSFSPGVNNNPLLPTAIYLPENQDQRVIRIIELFSQSFKAINFREIGIYEPVEYITGQNWFTTGSPTKKRPTYRKVFSGTIAAPGTTSIPHGLGNISGFTFTKIIGTAQNAAGTLFIPLPQAAPDDVAITINATNINVIAATATYNNFTFQIILEYLKT